tara:strand:- start:18225 stop:20069 length:1845 start_codon:yes stop_codon:yes gene_type:complete
MVYSQSDKNHALKLVLGALTVGLTMPAHAVNFTWGDIEGTFTSNFSVGASMRTEEAENDYLSPGNTNGEGRASVSTTDDGNLNYDKGDFYSMLFKGVHDLDLNAGNYGAFTRLKYWYDYALTQDVDHGHVANNYTAGSSLETSGFENLAQDSGAEFLDYYVYGSFDLASVPLELRAGNMVLSWGESTFIQNGINTINPFDVTALNRPGAEIKEALLPVGMVYANAGLTANLSLELFYQYKWDRTVLDECGTYWSSADVYGGGCDKLTLSTAAPDGAQIGAGAFMSRAADVEASDSGQWGLAAHYFVDSLNSAELGAYYINYHSRTPILSGVNATSFAPTGQPIDPKYFFEFPEDIEVFGVSIATNVGLWAVSGEISYRPEYPLQINSVEVSQVVALGALNEWSTLRARGAAAGPGGVVQGYDNVEFTQAQMTFIRFFDQVLGANRLSFAAEIGADFLGGMDDAQNYGRSGTFGIGYFEPFDSQLAGPVPGLRVTCSSHAILGLQGIVPNTQAQNCTSDGFTEDFSWGYRMRAGLDYTDAFLGINLTPNIAWSHDVKGYSPQPSFIEGRKAASVGVTADYLNTYKADFSYTNYFGGKYDDKQDRDFVSLSFSVAF